MAEWYLRVFDMLSIKDGVSVTIYSNLMYEIGDNTTMTQNAAYPVTFALFVISVVNFVLAIWNRGQSWRKFLFWVLVATLLSQLGWQTYIENHYSPINTCVLVFAMVTLLISSKTSLSIRDEVKKGV